MTNNNTIRHIINAKSGSKLEKAVLQILKDMEANLKRLKDGYQKKIETQQIKIERRL